MNTETQKGIVSRDPRVILGAYRSFGQLEEAIRMDFEEEVLKCLKCLEGPEKKILDDEMQFHQIKLHRLKSLVKESARMKMNYMKAIERYCDISHRIRDLRCNIL